MIWIIIRSISNVKSFKRLQKCAQGNEQNRIKVWKTGQNGLKEEHTSNWVIDIKTRIKRRLEPKWNEVESRLKMNWTMYPRRSFNPAKWMKRSFTLCPQKVIHSCQAEDIKGHLLMPSRMNWRSLSLYPQRLFTHAKRKTFKVIYQCQTGKFKVICSAPAKIIYWQTEVIQGTNWFKSSQSDPSSSLWQIKVNKQVTPNSKLNHDTMAIISQLIDLINTADYFWKLSGWNSKSEMSEWMMKTTRPWNLSD